jgi:hypothetical protein
MGPQERAGRYGQAANNRGKGHSTFGLRMG